MAKDNYSSSSSLAFYDEVPFWIKPRPKEVRRQLPKEVRRQLLESQTCLRFWQQPAGFEDSVISQWVLGEMTPAIQLADTHIMRMFKIRLEAEDEPFSTRFCFAVWKSGVGTSKYQGREAKLS